MRFYRLSHDSDLRGVIQTHTRYLFPSRTFIWTEDAQLRTCLGHVETGFMAEPDSPTGTRVPSDQITRFIAAVLTQYPTRAKRRPRRRGAFVVLVGLDAAGRSAVARSLCSQALEEQRFQRVRYFRWPPHVKRQSVFPLRELDNLPDRSQPGDYPLPSRLPILHVCKNLLLTKLGHWLRMRPLLRRNSLVLFDGHDYECLLDHGAGKDFGLVPPLLVRLLSLYPRPDLVVMLKVPAAGLRSRDPAPSEEEDLRQAAVLQQLRFDPQRTLQVDAASPPREIARLILQRVRAIVP
jgi:thymidylate kinase